MEKDVFTFEDFIKKPKGSNRELKPSEKLLQEVHQEIDEEENKIECGISDDLKANYRSWQHDCDNNEDTKTLANQLEESHPETDAKEIWEIAKDWTGYDEFTEEEEIKEEKINEEDSYYKLYKDKNEEFVCDISIEGANPDETSARIVIESKDWTLMFVGELKNGKCVVPIKRLNILTEGQIGNIRLEVIAEGNLFVPWEDKFKVKLSKKITVKVNEQKEAPKKNQKNGITVNVKK